MNSAEDTASVRGLQRPFINFHSPAGVTTALFLLHITLPRNRENLQDQDSFSITKKGRMPSEGYNIYMGYGITE